MCDHPFLLTPSSWLGQGKIQLSMVAEQLAFMTKWQVGALDAEGKIACEQEIQVSGLADVMRNQFRIFDVQGGVFVIELDNSALGKILGKGLINSKVIAWEFRADEIGFTGFEMYEKQDDEHYIMRAEYATDEQFRTSIEGKVWKKH